jgi:hypothetical protein
MVRSTALYRSYHYVTVDIHSPCSSLFGRVHAVFRRQLHQNHTHKQQRLQELVRHYVGRQLAEYYNQPAEDVVGRRGSSSSSCNNNNDAVRASQPSNPLSSLWGEWHWKRVFQNLYDTRQGHWLTPVELFEPYYSHIMANFCAQQATLLLSTTSSSNFGLELVELGCGRGTNASLILSYLKTSNPGIYEQLKSYTLIDSSPSLHKLQAQVLATGEHASKLKFELMDLVDIAEGRRPLLSQSNVPTIVLGLEILDNLPHDKIRGRTRKKLEQAEVQRTEGTNVRERFTALADPLLKTILDKVPMYGSPYPRWVPSIACGVLQHIVHQRDNVAVALADFDWLPSPDLDANTPLKQISEIAEGEPIVTDMSGKDHECYLTAPSHCDILFPTDFETLALFTKKSLSTDQSARFQVKVQKQYDFLKEWGPEHVAKTQSRIGWKQRHNPLLHDVSRAP